MPENVAAPTAWLTMPELAEALHETPGRIRRLLDEHYLVGSTRSGAFAVPAEFLADGRALPALRGTIIALRDVAFSDDEIIDWLFAEEDTLGRSPIASLRAGHKSEVRRVARTLA